MSFLQSLPPRVRVTQHLEHGEVHERRNVLKLRVEDGLLERADGAVFVRRRPCTGRARARRARSGTWGRPAAPSRTAPSRPCRRRSAGTRARRRRSLRRACRSSAETRPPANCCATSAHAASLQSDSLSCSLNASSAALNLSCASLSTTRGAGPAFAGVLFDRGLRLLRAAAATAAHRKRCGADETQHPNALSQLHDSVLRVSVAALSASSSSASRPSSSAASRRRARAAVASRPSPASRPPRRPAPGATPGHPTRSGGGLSSRPLFESVGDGRSSSTTWYSAL